MQLIACGQLRPLPLSSRCLILRPSVALIFAVDRSSYPGSDASTHDPRYAHFMPPCGCDATSRALSRLHNTFPCCSDGNCPHKIGTYTACANSGLYFSDPPVTTQGGAADGPVRGLSSNIFRKSRSRIFFAKVGVACPVRYHCSWSRAIHARWFRLPAGRV